MNAVEQGRAIVSITKTLKAFTADDPRIARHFAATRIAGKAGLFASSIRGYSNEGFVLEPKRLEVLYNDVGLDVFTFERDIKPWLVEEGLAYILEDTDDQESLVSTILTYDALLRSVVGLFESLEPNTGKARACQHLVHLASELPLPEDHARQQLASAYDEETANLAIDLARGLRLVAFTEPFSGYAVSYSDRVWRKAGPRAAKRISTFSQEDRTALEVIVETVQEHQGYPEELLRRWAINNNTVQMLDFAVGVGLVTRTGITTPGGTKPFLTTPHFYAEVAEEFGEDVCDRVKLFLNSIRNGQYFSPSSKGRIREPIAILRALLNKVTVGPATAIGRDYAMVERAGIVKVERSGMPGRYSMTLIQSDVAQKTLEVVQRQVMTPNERVLTVDDLSNRGRFVSIPESRAALAELPGEMREAEREFTDILREG